jgi:hypothetical protein
VRRERKKEEKEELIEEGKSDCMIPGVTIRC